MKKLLLLVLCIIVPFSIMASDVEEARGLYIDIYATGKLVRSTDFAAGGGFAAGYYGNGLTVALYANASYVFNPGGGPLALNMEILAEPGLRLSWRFFRSGMLSTDISLDTGFLTAWGLNRTFGEQWKFYLVYPGIVTRPGLTMNLDLGGGFAFSLGIFYQMAVYPRYVGSEYDGFGIVLRLPLAKPSAKKAEAVVIEAAPVEPAEPEPVIEEPAAPAVPSAPSFVRSEIVDVPTWTMPNGEERIGELPSYVMDLMNIYLK